MSSYSVRNITYNDIFKIKDIRNEQMDVLRQSKILTNEDQEDWYNNVILPSYESKTKTLNFVEAKLEESELRHKNFGGSRYVVEPNVKDGKGGLRDLHTLFWISKFAYNVDSISKLINIGALTKNEAVAIAEAQRFLFSVRCHLHYRAKREDDRLA